MSGVFLCTNRIQRKNSVFPLFLEMPFFVCVCMWIESEDVIHFKKDEMVKNRQKLFLGESYEIN